MSLSNLPYEIDVSMARMRMLVKAFPNIRLIELMILTHVAKHDNRGVTNKELSEAYSIPNSTVTRLIQTWDAIEFPDLFGDRKAQIIQQVISPEDKRLRLNHLTEDGIAFLNRVFQTHIVLVKKQS